MGIVFRQSIKTTIVTSFGAMLGLLVVYLSARFIPKQELGFSRNLLGQAVIGSQLILMGMHTTLYVWVNRYKVSDERRKILISYSLLIPIILTALFSVIYFLFKPLIVAQYQVQDIAFVSKYFAWLPLYTLLWGILTLLEQYLSAQMKVAASSFIREIILRILNIGLIILFGYGYIGFNEFIIYSVLVHAIPVAILAYLATRTEGFGISWKVSVIPKEERKLIIDFAVFHLFLNVSVSLLIYIDQVMLAALDKTGMEAAAVYFVAQSIISIYQIPYRALASASTPSINNAYIEGNMDKVSDMFSRSSINTLIATTVMAAIIIANLHNAVLAVGDKYSAIPLVVLILMIGRTFDMMTGLNNELLSISKYYRFNFYLTGGLVASIIVLNLFLVPKYGIYGAAWSSSIALFIYNLVKYLFLWNRMKLQPFSNNTFKVIICGAIISIVGYYLPFVINVFVDTLIRTSVILITYLLLLLWLKPSDDLREYLKTIRSNKRLF